MDRRRSSISCFRKSIGTIDSQLAIYAKVEKCLRSSFKKAFQDFFDDSDVDAENFKQECLGLFPELARDICRSTPIPLIEHLPNPTKDNLTLTKKQLENYSKKLLNEETEWNDLAKKLKVESKEAQEEYSQKSEVPHLEVDEMSSKFQKLLLKKPSYKNILNQCQSNLKEINSHVSRAVDGTRMNVASSVTCAKEMKVLANNLHNELIFSGRNIAKYLD